MANIRRLLCFFGIHRYTWRTGHIRKRGKRGKSTRMGDYKCKYCRKKKEKG